MFPANPYVAQIEETITIPVVRDELVTSNSMRLRPLADA